jgi:predicted nucleic acid-binding protein
VDVRRRVQDHIESGHACWNPVVRLELWNGARGMREKKALSEFERALPELPMSSEVWELAYELARRARAAGFTVPLADLLIAACARHHQARIFSIDDHFLALAKL